MKKKILSFSLILTVLLLSTISAEIILEQPKNIYNLGDSFSTSATIKTSSEINGFFQMFLICNNQVKEFYKEYIILNAGEEKKISPSLLLVKSIIENIKGDCIIRATLRGESASTKNFKISDLINIEVSLEQTEFSPGENIYISGKATRENSQPAEGFIELTLIDQDSEGINELAIINKGLFSVNFSLSKQTKAGAHLYKLRVYERDTDNNITNEGFIDENIQIKQIPTSLEIVIESKEINPGENVKVKAILHDQTGEKIASKAIITIKNSNNRIMEQREIPTDEIMTYLIASIESPLTWKIFAVSNQVSSESEFIIKEKESVQVILEAGIVIITNTGNIPYNKTVLVKIGNQTLNIGTNLKVGDIQKYTLTAPDGKYNVEIITDGKSQVSEEVSLTGRAIDAKKVAVGAIEIIRHPFIWVFIIAIFGFVAYTLFRKGYRKTFFGSYENIKKKFSRDSSGSFGLGAYNPQNKAELSLSIKGNKQDVSLICLKIKNFGEIESTKNNAKETLQKIISMAGERKAVLYENASFLFFILAPVITKTFKNEKNAVETAQKMLAILNEHNKFFQQRIDFGISVNYGAIIAKKEANLKFTGLGDIMSSSKKIAAAADKEVLISKEINEKVTSDLKTERKDKEGITAYTVREARNKEGSKTFISGFVKRMERDNNKNQDNQEKDSI